jgi:hypothetical protein
VPKLVHDPMDDQILSRAALIKSTSCRLSELQSDFRNIIHAQAPQRFPRVPTCLTSPIESAFQGGDSVIHVAEHTLSGISSAL